MMSQFALARVQGCNVLTFMYDIIWCIPTHSALPPPPSVLRHDQVAMGIPLHEIPDIRNFYGKADRYGHDGIDFMTDDYAPIRNHIIAARVTAENPDEVNSSKKTEEIPT